MKTVRVLILILSSLLFCAAPAPCAEVIDIPMPKGSPQRILFYPAPAAEETVILLPGGDGVVGIRDDGTADRPGHTFTRSMNLWEKQRINAVLFDAANGFAGCIAGLHEVLRRQGLLEGIWCLDPQETLSPGQREEIDRVYAAYPHLNDDSFVETHRERWLTP